jgi:hypothetical protein
LKLRKSHRVKKLMCLRRFQRRRNFDLSRLTLKQN